MKPLYFAAFIGILVPLSNPYFICRMYVERILQSGQQVMSSLEQL